MHGISDSLVKLFVGGIQPTCKEQDIRTALSDYCDYILKVDIKMKNAFLNRGYAFIFVTNEAIADKMTKMKFKLGDRILQIQNINKNSKEKEEYKLKRLYLKNLPPQTMDHELFQYFEPYGEIRSSYIIKDRFGQFRDYGFIDFERVEDVDNCLEALKKNPLVIKGQKIKVRRFIKLEDKKDDDDEENPTSDAGATLPQPSPIAQKRKNLQISPIIPPPPFAEYLRPEYENMSSPFVEVMDYPYPAYPGHIVSPFVYPPTFTSNSFTLAVPFEHMAIPTMCPPTTATSPFGVRAVPAAKKSLSDDDSFSKGHPAYPFDQTNGLKKGPSQEFEEDYEFVINRDLHTYQSDIELNHYFQNLRLNLRGLAPRGANLEGLRLPPSST